MTTIGGFIILSIRHCPAVWNTIDEKTLGSAQKEKDGETFLHFSKKTGNIKNSFIIVLWKLFLLPYMGLGNKLNARQEDLVKKKKKKKKNMLWKYYFSVVVFLYIAGGTN